MGWGVGCDMELGVCVLEKKGVDVGWGALGVIVICCGIVDGEWSYASCVWVFLPALKTS